ncbi:hypothetical protein SXCC_02288 [Gluconacetobacter sp. SXCC-1]|nr:hypothetical protein SXCC_02288 [Gluconacetobacter sp. SXCC-1]
MAIKYFFIFKLFISCIKVGFGEMDRPPAADAACGPASDCVA